MTEPYEPDVSLRGKLQRQITRFTSRKSLPAFSGRFVSFSFDDFPQSAATNGGAVLEENQVRGTYYTCTGQIGTHNHFGPICTAEDILRLHEQGHEIGCHTQNHIDCAVGELAANMHDASCNRSKLLELGIGQINSFAYPYGSVSIASKQVLTNSYATLRGVQKGINRRFTDANQLLAVPLEGDVDAAAFALSFLDKLVAKPGWLIFYSHDVQDAYSKWGCTPQLLHQIITAAKAMNVTIAPVTQVYQQITDGGIS
ncbi:MAG: polysaccharide deacetylase family protein [Robiginitomaculum sp.]|nr:polysaccharide deacetylase family protein [Robiginitomaculum sp.]